MSKGILSSDPSRADHRFVAYTLKNFVKGKTLQDPKEFNRVTAAFARSGGSWERLFKGSAADVVLLRRLVKLAVKEGYISKEPSLR